MANSRKIITNRYIVQIEGDAANSMEELGSMAIDEARERARLYVMPAEWSAKPIKGSLGDFYVTFQVTRKHY